jgi:hypothetical protein
MTFRNRVGALVLVLALGIGVVLTTFTPKTAYAQVDTGTVTGLVADPSGAAIPNAKIVIKNKNTGLERTVVSSASGTYLIQNLPPGVYGLTVASTGFASKTSTALVTVGGHLTLDVKLGVSATTEILVSGEDAGAEVNTTSQEVSQVVTPLQITQLPSLTRDPYNFVELSGNVASDPQGSTQRGVGVSFSGTRAASTDILLDGVENVDLFTQAVGLNIPLDSVQEYRVITNGFTAEYGRASGGVVNLITRGGTNKYHGSVYEYNRISALAANTFYEDAANWTNRASGLPNNPSDHFTENQFGYSFGGAVPFVLKNKLYFFSNTEWNRVRSTGQEQFAIPTPAFIASSAANTKAYFAAYGNLASGVTAVSTLPVAGFTTNPLEQVNVAANINAGAGSPVNAWFTFDRVDYNPSDRTNLYFRYDSYKDSFFSGTNSLSPYNGFNTGSTDYDQAAAVGITHSFSSQLTSSTKLTFSRVNGGQPIGTAGVVPGLYLYASNAASVDSVSGLPVVLPGYLPTQPGDAIPFQGPQNLYQVVEDLNYTRGRHNFHVGGSFLQVRDNRTFGAYLNAVEQAGSLSNGEAGGLNALKAGDLYSYSVAINPGGNYPCPVNTTPTPACEITLPVGPPSFTHENTFNDGSWYIQDTLKATSKLTLSLGLRWEYYGVQHDTKPNLDTNFYLGSGSSVYQQIRNGSVMPAPSSPVHALYAKSLKNYAPRIGFAYDLFGDGKTSIRGGYGIGYERDFGNVTYNAMFNPPNYGVVDLVSNQGGISQLTLSTNNYAPLSGNPGAKVPIPPVELRALDPHMKTAYDHQYSLSIEHEFMPNVLASIAYSGTRGIHLYSIANENEEFAGNVYLGDSMTGVTKGDRLNLQYGDINLREANADSYYNGVNLKVVDNNYQKYGLQLSANFTFSHALDDLSSTFSESNANFNVGYTQPFNPGLDRGNSDYDTRQRLVVSAVYKPKYLEFKHSSHLVQTLAGGLEFAPIFIWRTGIPYTIFDCTNGNENMCDRINAVPGLQYKGHAVNTGILNQFNFVTLPAAVHNTYADPITGYENFPTFTSQGSYQNLGMEKDQFYGPDNWNIDLGTYKNFKINDRYNIQLRGEFYNVLNHHNLYANEFNAYVDGTIAPGTYYPAVQALKGTPNGYSQSSADERRNVQLALRFEF